MAAVKFPEVLTGVRVLVVDDQPGVLDVLRMALELSGATPFAATSARDALARFLTDDVDVVVTDLNMPGEDGLWLAEQLHAAMRRSGRSVPLVAISGDPGGEEARAAMLTGGFAACLAKPVSLPNLCATVREFADARRRPQGS